MTTFLPKKEPLPSSESLEETQAFRAATTEHSISIFWYLENTLKNQVLCWIIIMCARPLGLFQIIYYEKQIPKSSTKC